MSTYSDTENTSSEDKSFFRIFNFSSSRGVPKSDSGKVTASNGEWKNCANNSKIPRPPMTSSYSVNETLKSNQSTGKTKKAPSMIPRSKSRKRNENDRPDVPPKVEFRKSQLNTVSTNRSKSAMTGENSEANLTVDRTRSRSRDFEEKEDKNLEKSVQNKKSTASLKSYQDCYDVMKKLSDLSFKDAVEDCLESMPGFRNGEQKPVGSSKLAKTRNDEESNCRNEVKEEKVLRDLYDTVKSVSATMFDNFKMNHSGYERERYFESESPRGFDSVKENLLSVQGQYEFTLKEISNIWKNTMSLIGSVRDHAIQYVEENTKSVDKEQLNLEAEMLELALDLAISYSKLKMDSLIHIVRKRIKAKKFKKSELENFMDSKAFSFLYNDDDLTAMARTVQDLNFSILKGEDLELE